jgi:hypothetical protein
MFLLLAFKMYVSRDYVNVRAFSEGDIIITEIMVDPEAVTDALGEWFEVYNPTDTAINMKYWVIRDDGADLHTISTDLYVQSEGFAVLGINADELTNGGVTVDYQYASFRLANVDVLGDEIVLEFQGVLIDRVHWSSGVASPGRSLQLHPDAFYSDWNDLPENWCDSTTLMPNGDYGTPSGFNVDCGYPPTPPPPVHDIAITNLNLAKTVICQGCFGNITVTVENQGDYTEIFNLTLSVNGTEIDTKETTFPNPGATRIEITFTFPNNPMLKDYYSIYLFAYATPVIGENDTSDNTCTNNSWVIISMIGDITGPEIWPDGKCDMRDVGLVARYFGQDAPPAPVNCDLTGPTPGVAEGKIDMRDIGLVARHFGETDP